MHHPESQDNRGGQSGDSDTILPTDSGSDFVASKRESSRLQNRRASASGGARSIRIAILHVDSLPTRIFLYAPSPLKEPHMHFTLDTLSLRLCYLSRVPSNFSPTVGVTVLKISAQEGQVRLRKFESSQIQIIRQRGT